MRAHARVDGTISGLTLLRAPVSILRDDRGVPHIVARNEHDLFFAQGYAEGSDRLFQMDLLRRFVNGELAEVFGGAALASDEKRARGSGARHGRRAVARAWTRARARYSARSATASTPRWTREPLPVEFRILAYRPRRGRRKTRSPSRWRPCSISPTIGTTSSRAIAAYRKGGFALSRTRSFRLPTRATTRRYARVSPASGPGPACTLRAALLARAAAIRAAPIGSNEWAAGAGRTLTGRALLANDPHLRLRIPGVWYLADLACARISRRRRDASRARPASSSVTTNASRGARPTEPSRRSRSSTPPADTRSERLAIGNVSRAVLHAPVTQRYYRAAQRVRRHHRRRPLRPGALECVRTPRFAGDDVPRSRSRALDRRSHAQRWRRSRADAQLRRSPIPSGRAAYVLAGEIPNDPVVGALVPSGSDLRERYGSVPFARCRKSRRRATPSCGPPTTRCTAPGYPLRLSPQFAPPYRAYRIAQLLRARSQDTTSRTSRRCRWTRSRCRNAISRTSSLRSSQRARCRSRQRASGVGRRDDRRLDDGDARRRGCACN